LEREALCGCLLASARAVDLQIPRGKIINPEFSKLADWWGIAQVYAVRAQQDGVVQYISERRWNCDTAKL
jgi:hypothetical protein